MDDYEDGSDGSSSLDLITSLANNATSAYEQSAALNANPLNTALIYGGTASTAQGAVASTGPSVIGTGSGIWFVVAAIAIIGIVVLRER